MSNREHDHEEWEEEIEDEEDDDIEEDDGGADEGSQRGGNPASNVAKSAGKKMGNKLGKAMAKKAMKMAIKLAAKVIAKLVALLGPYVLAGIAIVIIVATILYAAFDIAYETKGKEQEYQDESVNFDNNKKKDDEGEYISTNMSNGNKVVKSFYAYYTQQSYYKVIDKKMYKADDKKVEEVKDKYAREKEFMLSPDFLWSLDEHLNKNMFRYPEQFIQVVHHDPKTFELKQLTDKKEMLVAKSQEYDKDTKLAKSGKKVPGVWDYGFAPILQYKEFKEQKERRGTVTEMQVWNKQKQKFETQKVSNGKSRVENVDGFPKTVYMIEKVTSSIGTVSNKIEHEWQNTGEAWTKTISEEVKVPVRYYETVKDPVFNEVGLPLYYTVDAEGKKTSQMSTGVTKYPVTTSRKVEKYRTEKKKATRKIDGYVWSKEPRYEGEPDTSKVVGSKYMEDYMHHYVSYVPENAMGTFNLKDRTGKDIKGLEGILKNVEGQLNEDSEYDANNDGDTSGTSLDALMNVQGGSANFKKAMQYAEYYQKYGEMYGIDPLLLAAKGAQERGGVHSNVKDAGGAIGISQIQVTWHVNQPKKAFNYKTGKEDIVVATMDKLENVETNIQIGAMILQNEMKGQKYNPLIGLQGYNYGIGGINKVITAYASSKGTTVDAVKSNPKDTGWLPWRMKVHGTGYGDVQYIENVLKHYPGGSGQKPWIMDAKGNKVFIDGNIKMGEGIAQDGGSSGGFSFWDFLDVLKEKWGELFPDIPKEFSKEHVKFENKQISDAPIDILNMSFSMTEKKYFSEYGYITPKQWKEKYKLLFSAPPSMTGGDSSGLGEALNKYFPNGYGSVVAKAEKIAQAYNGKGISIQAPEGSKVLALADGTVKQVGRDFVVIDHGNGAVTRYSTLKEVKVKEGDKVKMGATVGISGKNVFFELELDGQPSDPSWVVGGGSLTGAFITPVKGRFTSGMSSRKDPFTGKVEYHTGVDIATSTGTPIVASADGEVIKAEYAGSYGNMVHIKHMVNGKQMSTLYAHMSSIAVKRGDKVLKGQVIGAVGSTGRSTGPHLHFEIHDGLGTYTDAPLDPRKFIKL